MINILKDKKVLVGGSVLVLFLLILIGYFYFNSNEEEIFLDESINIKEEKEPIESNNFYVDVKGAVKDPGVYLVNDGERVIDAINKAGGLNKNANTSNINLSKRLTSEMVVIVYTNNEVKNGSKKSECDTECNCEVIEVNNCIESESSSDKVNINTASIDELMTLSGIGQSKAESIISYREEKGNFKSIEEIKNVSGIGDALFESIKDGITV